MLYMDGVPSTRGGKKRHAFEEHRTHYGSPCGTQQIRKESARAKELLRVDAREFAVDPNACLSCVASLDLMEYRENNKRKPAESGARGVDYDPFGVYEDR
jgi:hypothetical protein